MIGAIKQATVITVTTVTTYSIRNMGNRNERSGARERVRRRERAPAWRMSERAREVLAK